LHAPVTRAGVICAQLDGAPRADRIQENAMASTRQAHAPRATRSYRWVVWAVAIVVLLGAYAVALRWVTLQVESGVEASIHPLTTQPQQIGE
jgi:hypothetical protein